MECILSDNTAVNSEASSNSSNVQFLCMYALFFRTFSNRNFWIYFTTFILVIKSNRHFFFTLKCVLPCGTDLRVFFLIADFQCLPNLPKVISNLIDR